MGDDTKITGEIVAATNTHKESSPWSIQCPMLNATNYTVWAIRMKVTLKVHKVWETIEPGSDNGDKNDMARALLFLSIPEALILQVVNLESSKAVWDAVKARNVGADRVKEARLQTLMAEFDKIKMKETDSIDDFAGKLSELSTKSAALGENIEEPKLVRKFLNSLPRRKYIQIIAALEQVVDLNTINFEDIVERLKAYEKRVFSEDDQQEEQGKLMYASMDSQNYQKSYGAGRGRGGRGRGRGRFGYQRNTSIKQGRDKYDQFIYD